VAGTVAGLVQRPGGIGPHVDGRSVELPIPRLLPLAAGGGQTGPVALPAVMRKLTVWIKHVPKYPKLGVAN